MRRAGFVAAVMALTCFPGRAAERPSGSREGEARLPRSGALEVGLALGADQVHGSLGAGREALGELGATLELEVAVRAGPRWTVGAHVGGSVYGGGRSLGRGAAAGVQATRRFLLRRAQPWISAGAGWRALWLSSREGDGPCHGVELLRLRVGVDQALTPSMSISPVLGVTVATFLSHGGAEDRGDFRPSVAVFAGLMSRFDVGSGAP